MESVTPELAALYLELERRRCKEDLCYLMEEYLGYSDLAPVHREVRDKIKEIEGTTRKGLFLLPRGHLKSTEITVSYTLSRLLKDPNIRVLISNATLENSKGFLREIKSHLEKNERLRALFGDVTNQDEKWSEMQILVKNRTAFHKEPTVQVTSVDKSVVSQHYDLIIGDDLVSRDSITTKEQRDKLVKYLKDLYDLLEPGGVLLLIGTRWHYDDLYGYILAENETTKSFSIMKRAVFDEEGNPIFPKKFTLEHISSLRRDKGTFEFNSQYMNEPVADEEADFKRQYFRPFPVASEHELQGPIFITVDPALSRGEKSDNTGIVVNKVVDGKWYILRAYKIRCNPTELVDELFYLADRYKPHEIGIEDIMYTAGLEYDATRRMQETGKWFRMTKLKHRNRMKTERIRALIPLFERGNILMSEDTQELQDELSQFPLGKHDDVLDALAYQLDIVKAAREYTGSRTLERPESRIISPVLQTY